MSKLNGKVAIVTGATSGMGLDTAKLFLDQGAKVVLTGRSEEKLQALESSLEGDYLLVQADAANVDDSNTASKPQTPAAFSFIVMVLVMSHSRRCCHVLFPALAPNPELTCQVPKCRSEALFNYRMVKRHLQSLRDAKTLLHGPGQQMRQVFRPGPDHLRTYDRATLPVPVNSQQALVFSHDPGPPLVGE